MTHSGPTVWDEVWKHPSGTQRVSKEIYSFLSLKDSLQISMTCIYPETDWQSAQCQWFKMCPSLDLSLPHIFTHPRKALASEKQWSQWSILWAETLRCDESLLHFILRKLTNVPLQSERQKWKNLFDFCISDLGYNKHGKSKILMGKKIGYCFCSLFFKNKGESNPSWLFLLNTHLPVVLGHRRSQWFRKRRMWCFIYGSFDWFCFYQLEFTRKWTFLCVCLKKALFPL